MGWGGVRFSTQYWGGRDRPFLGFPGQSSLIRGPQASERPFLTNSTGWMAPEDGTCSWVTHSPLEATMPMTPERGQNERPLLLTVRSLHEFKTLPQLCQEHLSLSPSPSFPSHCGWLPMSLGLTQ